MSLKISPREKVLNVKNILTTNYNMNQICTNKSQSSRLLEAGIRPDTADCYLQRITETDDWSNNNVLDEIIESWMNKQVLLDMDGRYPAWSLSKLIGMMPDQVECEGYNYYLFMLPRDKEFTIKYSAGSNLAQSYCRESLFDAIAEMIEWLIKEGCLDKKYLAVKCGDCQLIEDEDANGEAWCSFHQKPVRCYSEACEDILEKGGSNEE